MRASKSSARCTWAEADAPVATPEPQVFEQRPVSGLRGVGPALAEKLAKLGVTQVQDLLFVLPSRYEDRTQISEIGSVRPGAARGGRRRNPAHRSGVSPPPPASMPHRRWHGLADVALLLFLGRAAGQSCARYAHSLFRRSAARSAGPRDRPSGISPGRAGSRAARGSPDAYLPDHRRRTAGATSFVDRGRRCAKPSDRESATGFPRPCSRISNCHRCSMR